MAEVLQSQIQSQSSAYTGTKRRSATLATILMIEDTIKAHNGELSKTELWKALPRKVMYQTFKGVVKYLEESKKIVLKNRKIIWIYFPGTFERLVKETKSVNFDS